MSSSQAPKMTLVNVVESRREERLQLAREFQELACRHRERYFSFDAIRLSAWMLAPFSEVVGWVRRPRNANYFTSSIIGRTMQDFEALEAMLKMLLQDSPIYREMLQREGVQVPPRQLGPAIMVGGPFNMKPPSTMT